jgi:hypothetical protein
MKDKQACKDSLAIMKHEITHMMTALLGVTVQGQWVSLYDILRFLDSSGQGQQST